MATSGRVMHCKGNGASVNCWVSRPISATAVRYAKTGSAVVGRCKTTGRQRSAARSVSPRGIRDRPGKLEVQASRGQQHLSNRVCRVVLRRRRRAQQDRDQNGEVDRVQLQRGMWASLYSGRVVTAASLRKNSSFK